MAGEDNIKGTGVLTNKAPEIPTSEPAFDDGSLACLGINTDTRRKMFTCPAKSQTELVGKTFWIVDYFANIEGKDGQEKYIFKAKWNLTDPDCMTQKKMQELLIKQPSQTGKGKESSHLKDHKERSFAKVAENGKTKASFIM